MGFERVAAVLQATQGFTDFSKPTSNYDTDLFSPIFDKLTELSGKTYTSSLPVDGKPSNEGEEEDIAFRVIGDHLRALCFSIADGTPGNSDRNMFCDAFLGIAMAESSVSALFSMLSHAHRQMGSFSELNKGRN